MHSFPATALVILSTAIGNSKFTYFLLIHRQRRRDCKESVVAPATRYSNLLECASPKFVPILFNSHGVNCVLESSEGASNSSLRLRAYISGKLIASTIIVIGLVRLILLLLVMTQRYQRPQGRIYYCGDLIAQLQTSSPEMGSFLQKTMSPQRGVKYSRSSQLASPTQEQI